MELKLDLRDERNAEIVRRQFEEHGLLVARAQSLTHDHQIALMGQLGTVLSHVSTVNVVSNVRSDGYLGNSEVAYHSDASYTARPMHAISLHALRIEGTTSTKIASGIRAFDRLPAALQTQITQLKAIHLVPVSENTLGGRQRLSDYPDEGPRAVHPVVMLDPVTNKHTLYVPYTNTDSIVGWEADRSQEGTAQPLIDSAGLVSQAAFATL
jgi:taurine dioxygenase